MADQGTAEWRRERSGCWTASNVGLLLETTKAGKRSAKGFDYVRKVAAERLMGDAVEEQTSWRMRRGSRLEDRAAAAYTIRTGCDIVESGFTLHPDIPHCGASLDRHVTPGGMNQTILGLLEIKCPSEIVHLDRLWMPADEAISPVYYAQVQWQIECARSAWDVDIEWCDWVSYSPRFSVAHRLKVHRIAPDEQHINELTTAIHAAEAEVAEILHKVKEAA